MSSGTQKTREHILARIDAFLDAEGMSEYKFGLLVVSDHKFVPHLRDPAFGVTLTSIEKAEAFMRKKEARRSVSAAA